MLLSRENESRNKCSQRVDAPFSNSGQLHDRLAIGFAVRCVCVSDGLAASFLWFSNQSRWPSFPSLYIFLHLDQHLVFRVRSSALLFCSTHGLVKSKRLRVAPHSRCISGRQFRSTCFWHRQTGRTFLLIGSTNKKKSYRFPSHPTLDFFGRHERANAMVLGVFLHFQLRPTVPRKKIRTIHLSSNATLFLVAKLLRFVMETVSVTIYWELFK